MGELWKVERLLGLAAFIGSWEELLNYPKP